MSFSSSAYVFLFLPLVFAGYMAARKFEGFRIANLFLLASSLWFYATSGLRPLLLLIALALFNFMCIQVFMAEKTHRQLRLRKAVFFSGMAVSLSALGYFKYKGFFVDVLHDVFGINLVIRKVMLPLAISFFTFQQLSVLIDAYRGKVETVSPLEYALFVFFFPQVVAGPILRYSQVQGRFLNRGPISGDMVSRGFLLFLFGFLKKVMIADVLGVWADAGYQATEMLSATAAWVVSLCYTFQLYFDFSGYTDMALGSALMFGILLPQNFDSPYKALSIRDFWRRWHITLSTWLRDYLYIPLGGGRKGFSRTQMNIAVTFLLCGLWHGAGWPFLAWGAFHGLALIVQNLWKKTGLALPRLAAWAITFLFVNCAWILFRAESLETAGNVFRAMFGMSCRSCIFTFPVVVGFNTVSLPVLGVAIPEEMTYYLIFAGVLLFFFPNAFAILGLDDHSATKRKIVTDSPMWAICCGLLMAMVLLSFMGTNISAEFIYANF